MVHRKAIEKDDLILLRSAVRICGGACYTQEGQKREAVIQVPFANPPTLDLYERSLESGEAALIRFNHLVRP